MKFTSVLGAPALASLALAAPLVERAAINDVDILQFALTLEHLENTFYKQALAQLSPDAFFAEGYSGQFYNQLQYIAEDEQTHVQALEAAIKAAGAKPVKACTYNFGFYDAHSFLTVSSLLEGTGTSAYLGAAPAIKDPAYLTVAGAILAVEALHTSQQRAYLGEIPFANPFYTPLDANSVFTLASSFITSCPSSNAKLPFVAFPTLTDASTAPAFPGGQVTVVASADWPGKIFMTFVNGLTTMSVKPDSIDGHAVTATVPSTLRGQTYVLLTNKKVTSITPSAVLFGPSIIEVTPPAASYNPSIL